MSTFAEEAFKMFEKPWLRGRFSLGAGLRPLRSAPVFMPPLKLDHYLHNKQLGHRENLQKYYPQSSNLSLEEIRITAEVLQRQILRDFGEVKWIQREEHFRDQIDYLLSHVAEDFALWKCVGDIEWMALIHLFAPNHWAAEEKVGRPFREVHAPVPEFERVSANALVFFNQVQSSGPVERYAWGLATDTVLNRHPANSEKGRSFEISDPRLWIRLERQVLFAVTPKLVGFTIHTSFLDLRDFSPLEKRGVRDCLENMGPEVLRYKGLESQRREILHWIDCQL